jgi:hypothetical protein
LQQEAERRKSAQGRSTAISWAVLEACLEHRQVVGLNAKVFRPGIMGAVVCYRSTRYRSTQFELAPLHDEVRGGPNLNNTR